jgi:HK97 family phage portal protein
VSLFARLVSGLQRDSLSQPSEDLIAAFAGRPTASGRKVTVQNSLALIPVFRAVGLRAGAIGSLPLEVYRHTQTDGEWEKEEVSHTARPWQLLHDKPNSLMPSSECWKMVEAHLSTWGNAFLWKERGEDGRIANLWPLSPRRVQVGRSDEGQPAFLVDTYAPTPPGQDYFNYGQAVVVDDREILHVRGLGDDGLIGYSPIQMARELLGSMASQQEYEGRFWANDATPGVTLVHPNKLTPDGVDRLRALWDNRHKGPNKARATAVLGEGVKVEPMTIPMADAQFVQISQMRRTDVALLFGLPPYMLAGETGSSMTYSNSETQSLDFVKWSLRDSMTTIEQFLTWDPDLMPQNWFAKFCADEILRGAQQERYAAYSTAPHLLIDEVREAEDMPPLPDGKGQVLAKTIGPPRGTTIPAQDQPLEDQPTPGEGQPTGDVPSTDVTGGT